MIPSIDSRSTPIGAIVRNLEWSFPLYLPPEERDSAIQQVYERFDHVLQDREDYKVWRTAVTPHFARNKTFLGGVQTQLSAGWTDWSVLASNAAEASPDPVVIWSLIAIAPYIFQAELEQHETPGTAAVFRLADQLHVRLRHLTPLPSCPASCGIAAFHFLIRREHLFHKRRRVFDLAACAELFREVREWLAQTDRTWAPGRKLNLRDVEVEGKRCRLRPGYPAHEFSLLAQTFGALRTMVSTQVHSLDPVSEQMLTDAYKFSRSAWLTARSRRIDEMQYQAARGATERGRAKVQRAFLVEFQCHLNLCSAARDAGEYLESAKQLYLLFRLIPDEFRELEEVKKQLAGRSLIFRYLKEVGLELDPRFATNKTTLHIQQLIAQRHERRARLRSQKDDDVAGTPAEVASSTRRPALKAVRQETGFALRVRRDQAWLPEWKDLLDEIQPLPNETPIGYLLTVTRDLADDGRTASPKTLIAAFRMALRYGYVRSAGKILSRAIRESAFDLTPVLLLDFVHAVRRCSQLDPFGLRQDRWEEWRQLIKDGCQALFDRFGEKWMPAHNRLWIHETLINRTHVHHKSLKPENARRLYEKWTGFYNIDELREFYDLDYDFHGHAHGVATRDAIVSRFKECSLSALGSPVGVSLMLIGNALSVVGIGHDDRVVSADCVEPGLSDDVDSLARESEFWFKMQETDATRHITWPASLQRIAHKIVAVVEDCDPSARVILISMDTLLAQLPWQHLINRMESLTKRLVSIIPSFTAFTLADRNTASTSDVRKILSTEPGPEITAIVEAITDSTNDPELRGSNICIVAGHGRPPAENRLPTVCIGPQEFIDTLDKWLDVAGSRVNVFHCCHSGMPRPLFMQEFGGIAGLVISLGTRSVLAPVAEVDWSTAVALQRSLFDDPRREIGASYLAAISENPSCCLYSLYGSPYEKIWVSPSAVERVTSPNGSDVSAALPERPVAVGRPRRTRSMAPMRRYYMKIPTMILSYFPGSPPPDWKERAFDDATECGTRLTLMELVPNEKGVRAALFGVDFYFEVGIDKGRTDTLFLMRIERAKPPSRVPTAVDCEVRLWPGGDPEPLDTVGTLFGEACATDALVLVSKSPRRAIVPSPEVRALLVRTSPEVRAQFRPSAVSPSTRELLASLRTLWKRHRLDRMIQPTPRQAALLNGAIEPGSLVDDEWDALVDLFGFRLLNSLASHPEVRSELDGVLKGLAECPDPSLHLGIWAAMTAGLSGSDLRRELSVSGDGLASLSQSGPHVATISETIVVPVLLESASRDGDVALQAILASASPGALVLGEIASWARRLEFDAPALSADTPGEHMLPSAAQVPSPGDAAAVDEWVLRLHGLSRELMDTEAARMRLAIAESSAEPGGSSSVREFAAFVDRVVHLQSAAGEWLERLPRADALVRDRLEADAAAAKIGHEAVVAILRSVPVVTPRQLKEIVAFRLTVPADVQELLREPRDDGHERGDLKFVIKDAALFAQIQDVLGDAAIADLMTHVAERSAQDAAIELASILRAVEFFNTQVGSLEGIGVAAILRRAAKERLVSKPYVKVYDGMATDRARRFRTPPS